MLFHSLKAARKQTLTFFDSIMYASLFFSLPEYLKKESDLKVAVTDQLANPRNERVTKYYGFINDKDAAKRFGTNDINDYSYWSWRSCGIALVHTLIAHFNGNSESLFQIATNLDKEGGYLKIDDTPKGDIGWKHTALADYLKSHNVNANLITFVSSYHLIFEIFSAQFLIVSIESRLAKNSSHLVLVSGIIKSGPELYLVIHDPYNLDGKGGRKLIPFEEFRKIFLHRGIAIR